MKLNHPLPVGSKVEYDSSACGCSGRTTVGIITKVSNEGGLIIYEIDNKTRIPSRRVHRTIQ